MGVFAASDIVEVAIRIEENGVNFYKFAEQITKQQEAKELFAHFFFNFFLVSRTKQKKAACSYLVESGPKDRLYR